MKFLVDENLPVVLAEWLVAQGHDAAHVKSLGLDRASDRSIRARAEDTGAIVISKDADFAAAGHRLRVIWVRIGNTTNANLVRVWGAAWPAILAALDEGERLIEVGG